MPAGTSHGGMTQSARNGEPQPAPFSPNAPTVEQKRDLKSWWKNFSGRDRKRDEDKGASALPGIFGVPLTTSVRYANVAISLQDAEGKSYVYGYVPIVVAKCGVFLKEKATDIEGIFRLSGSEKRIKELKEAFNSPDRYGKGLDWSGYTVHDAANILRRYFNNLPEPIIPLDFYERFREPLRNHQSQAVGQIEGQSPSVGDFDPNKTIRIFQSLITELPPLNRQLLLYILDLLAVFASKSDLNKMTTPNLAAIFQPGILSHPHHDMAPPEYRLSQDVLIFLIENQDHFLIGMQGTAADDKTKEEVESGPPTPSISKSPTMFGRSSSSASKVSGIRRSVSVSSKHSKKSATPSPATPVLHSPLATPTGSGSVHRSNTVPTSHSPRGSHTRFQRDQIAPESPSPSTSTPMYTPAEMPGAYPFMAEAATAVNEATPASPNVIPPSEQTTPLASPPIAETTGTTSDSKSQIVATPEANVSISKAMTDPVLPLPMERAETSSPNPGVSKTFTAIFGGKSPTPDTREAERKPKKLQKKRLPGSANPSAQSSQHSLFDSSITDPIPSLPTSITGASTLSIAPVGAAAQMTPTQQQTFLQPTSSAESTPLKPPPNVGLKADPPMSPANSYRSHSEFTEGELDEVQPLDDTTVLPGQRGFGEMEPADGKKKRFWERKKGESVSYGAGNSLNAEAQRSRSSVTSGERKSLTLDRNVGSMSDPESFNERDPRDKNQTHSTWIGRKLAERAEKKEDKRRTKSPPPPLTEQGQSRGGGPSMQSLTAAASDATLPSPSLPVPTRGGKSIDIRRDDRRSFDAGREQLSVVGSNPSKKNMDIGSRERKSLLELGEEHVIAQRNADATSAATAAFASAPAAGKGQRQS